ncbi:NAD(P)/FAD-dependent oxidoreductase [Enemella sp. A6]|uniref:NAD(P)/FAD-dependent oxidoreductase n=1 Tax=Enemella sp. A6 TaxID=3440152 RepID=UPI003EB9F182
MKPTVAIVGGGPAGLSAAAELAPHCSGEVLVIERESEAGGIPRHSDHLGYGIRDRKSFMTGPKYAKKLLREAQAAGARIWTQAQVTGWAETGALQVTSRDGLFEVDAEAVLLATGARERPRAARMVWGDRPEGVYTTGQLQNAVHVHHQTIGKEAIVVGAELVSWSAVLTLKEAGCATRALISEHPRAESYALFNHLGKAFFRTKVVQNSRVIAIKGKHRVEAVEIEDAITKERQHLACDTVVFTGNWVPDYELAWSAGLEIDHASGAPVVDNSMQTSKPGVFAAGNLNHPVETADVVSLEGQFVAERILEYLTTASGSGPSVRLTTEGSLKWVSPSRYAPTGPAPAREKLVCWVDKLTMVPTIEVHQAGIRLARIRSPWPASPGRAFRIPSSVLKHVRSDMGDVTISVS